MKRAALLLIACSACADAALDEDVAAESQPVIGGVETRDAPEVGKASFSWGSYCTATLISPRVAITAAHCLDYRTADASGRYGRFIIDKVSGGTKSFAIDRYRAFVRDGLAERDVGLLRLAEPVPADVATPAPLARENPRRGTPLVLFGYGCNDNWDDQTGGGTKRKTEIAFGSRIKNTLCPGDSGGPVRIESTGEVLKINSGWKSGFLDPRHDVFGDVPRHVSTIEAQMRAWSEPEAATGLRASYFDDRDPKGDPKVVRVDPAIDFDWGSNGPDAIVDDDTFSARWEGKLEAPTSETYTLETLSDDGIRLWVDGKLVIDQWNTHSPTTHRASVALTANELHSLRLEYFEAGGGAVAKLYWSSPSTPRQIIPTSRLRLP